jgi:hypothetical protein
MREVILVDNCIEFQVNQNCVYDIPVLQIIDDYETGRMNWPLHLRDKNWFDKSTEAKFVHIIRSLGLEHTIAGEPPLDAA